MDSEEPENLVFFYHPDHLGSTSYVTDADGNIAQHIEYIPYGEVFVEERNSQFSTNFLFNAKELDNETGLYYYGARYLDPTGGMWLSVDPMWEKYAGMSPYNYCAGNPVKMVDPDGRYTVVQISGEEDYVYDHTANDGKGAFYEVYNYNGGSTNMSSEPFVPAEDSKLAQYGKDFQEMKKTEAGRELLDYFNTADRNCYVRDSRGNAGANGEETLREGLRGWTIFIDRNDVDSRKIPTTSGTDQKNSPMWVVIGHEMAHAKDYLVRGIVACKSNWAGFYNTEKYATHMENRMRGEAGLPLRTHYDANVPESAILLEINGHFFPRSSYQNESGGYYYYFPPR